MTFLGRALALALFALVPLDAAADTSDTGYKLGVGDTVHAVVVGRADLSGDFLIGHDRTMRIPLLGGVPAAGQTLDELETAITGRLRQIFEMAPQVTLRVAIYRPIFVFGAVATPGEQAFNPGITALKAFAKAGGAPSLRNLTAGRLAETAAADFEIRQARSEINMLLLREARIKAALAGASDFELPPDLLQLAKSPPFDAVVARERETLLLANESIRVQQEMVTRQLAGIRDEIEALEGENAALETQGKSVAAELSRIQGLAKKGLTTSDRVMELQQLKADNDAERYRVLSHLSRARQNQPELELRTRRVVDEMHQQHLTELGTVGGELDRARGRLESASARLSILSEVEFRNVDSDGTAPSFMIMREENGTIERRSADAASILEPGDVLEVQINQQGQPVALR